MEDRLTALIKRATRTKVDTLYLVSFLESRKDRRYGRLRGAPEDPSYNCLDVLFFFFAATLHGGRETNLDPSASATRDSGENRFAATGL